MQRDFLFDLQYFAEGEGAAPGGGEGADAGVSTADAGQKTLEELGVPAEHREKWAKSRAARALPAAEETREGEGEPEAVDGDAGRPEDKLGTRRTLPARRDERMSWEEILKDPQYRQAFDSQVQGIVRQRLAKSTRMQETFQKLQPALEFLATKYKIPTENLDYEALGAAIQADDSIVQNYAEERGTSLETARADLKDRLELERLRRENRISLDRQTLDAHILRLRQQAEEVRQFSPDFDLDREIAENAVFARMTSPQIGMSVADAYFACHRKEILAERDRAQAQQALVAVANTVRANRERPPENGTGLPGAVELRSYRQMPQAERDRFKEELRKRWARGEKPEAGSFG